MSDTDSVTADQILLKCPSCGACEAADAADLAEKEFIVCRECGGTWPLRGPRSVRRRRQPQRAPRPLPAVIEAERRPLVTFSDRATDNAWKAKIEGDRWPEPPPPRRLAMTAAAVASMAFLAAFFGGREAAVAALPDLAGLYAAIGMPVNLSGIAIEDVGAERARTADGARLTVRATIRNAGAADMSAPVLVAVVADGATPVESFRIDPPAKRLAPGETLVLLADLGKAPEGAAEVVVRLPRPGETLPTSVAKSSGE